MACFDAGGEGEAAEGKGGRGEGGPKRSVQHRKRAVPIGSADRSAPSAVALKASPSVALSRRAPPHPPALAVMKGSGTFARLRAWTAAR